MIQLPFAPLGWCIMVSAEAKPTAKRAVARDNKPADELGKLAACNILVVGDAMLDRYWLGAVERISPEAPVPVVEVKSSYERIGGAGNVACNIAALGGKCTLLSIVGDDEAGGRVAEIATQSGINPQLVTDQSAKTTIKLRVLSRNQQLLRADFESPPPRTALDATTTRFANLLAGHQVVVLSDYGKGGLARIETLIDLAARARIPVLVDPKGGDFSRYRGATMVTPNLKEFEQVAGAITDDEDMAARAHDLMTRHQLEKILVTMSDRGMVLFSRQRDPIRREARVREVYDVSGAGDSVIAVMAMATAAGLPDDTGLVLANSTAGLVVSKLGTATATRDELKAALERDYPR